MRASKSSQLNHFGPNSEAELFFERHGHQWYRPLFDKNQDYEPEELTVQGTNKWSRRLPDGTIQRASQGFFD